MHLVQLRCLRSHKSSQIAQAFHLLYQVCAKHAHVWTDGGLSSRFLLWAFWRVSVDTEYPPRSGTSSWYPPIVATTSCPLTIIRFQFLITHSHYALLTITTVILVTPRTNSVVPRPDPVSTTSANSSNRTTNRTIYNPSGRPISASCLQRQRVSSSYAESPSSITSPAIRQRSHRIFSTNARFTPGQKSLTT